MIPINKTTRLAMAALLLCGLSARAQQHPVGGADEQTPSQSEYFSWINNTNEGASAWQTSVNLDFFRWLHDRYGMKLDIYAFDAGAIDGASKYGSTSSARFRAQFPEGFGPLSRKAGEMGTRLGVWLGPDGYGDTETEAQQRSDMLVGLVKDYHFHLFKMDGVCGALRPEKREWFDKTFTRIREIDPGFIMLNHRLDLGWAVKHATTFLLGGDETYIDVLMTNSMTAPHHRGSALSRRAPDNLTRLTEDHGVCLSSCLDFWDDDLVLQAFNRCLIIAPELYGNPWLLRDDEYPRLAYLFNLHKQYAPILVNGQKLPETQYGPGAISRGDGATRFVTLRNLTWEPVTYRISLDGQVGLESEGPVQARLYHPYIQDLGRHAWGSTIEVEVLPFRAALVKLTTAPEQDAVALSGIPYLIVNDCVGNTREVKLLGMPGQTYKVRLTSDARRLSSAVIDGVATNALARGKAVTVKFPGKPLTQPWHRRLADMSACDVPADAEALYLSTCFAADNNAFEARSLKRSGETHIPQVKAARDAFFSQQLFRDREIWDRNLFDGDPKTAFSIMQRWTDARVGGSSMFCLDMGQELELDSVSFETLDEYSLSPLKSWEGLWVYVSRDMKNWQGVNCTLGLKTVVPLRDAGPVRYLRFAPCPLRLSEVTGYKDGQAVDRSLWHASNLFRPFYAVGASHAWKAEFTITEAAVGSYLCVPVEGRSGEEGAWVGFKVDGRYVGCPDRAPSFQTNTWEYRSQRTDKNYTYYLPVTSDMVGKTVEAYVLATTPANGYPAGEAGRRPEDFQAALKPSVWITSYPIPFQEKTLTIQ